MPCSLLGCLIPLFVEFHACSFFIRGGPGGRSASACWRRSPFSCFGGWRTHGCCCRDSLTLSSRRRRFLLRGESTRKCSFSFGRHRSGKRCGQSSQSCSRSHSSSSCRCRSIRVKRRSRFLPNGLPLSLIGYFFSLRIPTYHVSCHSSYMGRTTLNGVCNKINSG